MTTVIVLLLYSLVVGVIFFVVEFHAIKRGNDSFKIPKWLWENVEWIRKVNW